MKKLTRLAHIMALMSVTGEPLPKRNTDVPIVFLDDLLPPQATLQHNARKKQKTKNKRKKEMKKLTLILLALLLTACDNQPKADYQGTLPPAQQAVPQQNGIDTSSALIGATAGAMLAGSNRNQTVQRETVIVKERPKIIVVQQPAKPVTTPPKSTFTPAKPTYTPSPMRPARTK